MNARITWSVLLLLFVISGCDSHSGPDSLRGQALHAHSPMPLCSQCHSSANSPDLDPLVTNGTGTFGKHIRHVQERAIACERCHYNYLNAQTHMNGGFNTGDSGVVNLNITGPSGTWDPVSGRCSGVACHGMATLDWYGTNTWSLPACTTCHVSGFSSALDPAVTNSTPPSGRHFKHVSERAIDCERCHYNYPGSLTHANGVLDTDDPAVNIVRFNIVGSAATWTNDSGPGTGGCASVSCHGPDVLGWYGTATWTLPAACTACHSSGYLNALDPIATNGSTTSGTPGKHIKHVVSFNMSCTKCHADYPARTSHANGSMDTPDPAFLLVYFDSTNPTGTWINDAGAEAGNCSNLVCHGTESPAWYGDSTVSFPPCVACHSGPIGTRRQIYGADGDFGQNINIQSHHVAGGNDPTSAQCQVCHDLSYHMGGTIYVKNADSGTAVPYDSASPASAEAFCLSCHDSDGSLTAPSPLGPFADGAALGTVPNAAGNKIAGYWNGARNVHKNTGGLTCLGTGAANTGCHGNSQSVNAHGSHSRGLLTRNMNLPVQSGASYTYTDFKLCFDCHDGYPAVTKEVVLGYREGGNYDLWWAPSPYKSPTAAIQSLFRDRYIADAANYPAYWGGIGQPYNNNFIGDPYTPLHNYHLLSGDSWMQTVWSYRGNETGKASCTTCHNVHGSPAVRSTYQEFGIAAFSTVFAGGATDQYTKLVPDANYEDSVLKAYPINCNINCHAMAPGTSYWHTPSGE